MELTEEQKKLIEETITNKEGVYSCESVAGSGKTFTILKAIEYIKKHQPKAKILYIVFNKQNQLEAQSRLDAYGFITNPVKVCTCNAYGYEKWLQTIGHFDVIPTLDKDTIYKFQRQSYLNDVKYSKHRPFKKILEMYDSSKLTLETFCKDLEFHWDDSYRGFDRPKDCKIIDKFGNEKFKYGIPVDNYSVITKDHIPVFKKIIEYYESQKKYSHGMYMKAVAYSKSEKTARDEWDYVFFDEAQDANYFVLKLLKKQKIHKIYFIGDRRQSIYNFGGINENVFNIIKFDKKYTLSKSFRFGESIANIANIILNGDGLKVIGTEQEERPNNRVYTRLYRTNAKMFKDALDLAYNAKKKNISIKIEFMRTEQEDKSNNDMIAFLGIYYKYVKPEIYYDNRFFFDNIYKSEIISMFESRLEDVKRFNRVYNEMYDYLSEDIHAMFNYAKDDDEFILKFNALERCKMNLNPTYLITMITMHRSKGLEFDNVTIAENTKLLVDDGDGTFHKSPDFEQELNLMYVAATRSRKILDASIFVDELRNFGINTKENSFIVK